MSPKTIIILIFSCVSGQVFQTKRPVLLQLTSEQIMQTFDNAMSDDYIKLLAKDFAARAAAHFMNEIKNQKENLLSTFSKQAQENKDELQSTRQTKSEVSEMVAAADEAAQDAVKTELDEDEALRLIQDPSPDGDHLDSSGEFSEKEQKNNIPVIQVTKINGIYYRRLLGMI